MAGQAFTLFLSHSPTCQNVPISPIPTIPSPSPPTQAPALTWPSEAPSSRAHLFSTRQPHWSYLTPTVTAFLTSQRPTWSSAGSRGLSYTFFFLQRSSFFLLQDLYMCAPPPSAEVAPWPASR